MKRVFGGLFALFILLLYSGSLFATKDTYPSTIGTQPSGGSLCKNTAVTLTAGINTTTCGSGSPNNVSRTFTWFQTSTSCSGGSVVQTTTSTATSDSYSPPTATIGTQYYYCKIT